ncbi:hypothetical protein F4775DRAFT_597944 [Biscogniauxia sp. FL1348]|nr:hypothetical protein F4775DRAFT_597944 [Biscogniauxia sp. FL1348]
MTTTTASQASTVSYSYTASTDSDSDNDNRDVYRDDDHKATDSKRAASIDITNAPVTISWAQGEQTAELDFDLHFHGPEREAFFKLHGAIGVKASAKPPRRSYTTRIYLFILPEDIQSLTLDTSWPNTISTMSNPAVRLSFVLARTPALVMPVPEFKSLTPKNKTFGAILDGIASLASSLMSAYDC